MGDARKAHRNVRTLADLMVYGTNAKLPFVTKNRPRPTSSQHIYIGSAHERQHPLHLQRRPHVREQRLCARSILRREATLPN